RGGGAGRTDGVEGGVEDPALDEGGPAPALVARPGDRRPAAVEEPPLPVARDGEPHRILHARPAVIAPPRRGQAALEPGARLVGEGHLGGGEGEVHRGGGA